MVRVWAMFRFKARSSTVDRIVVGCLASLVQPQSICKQGLRLPGVTEDDVEPRAAQRVLCSPLLQ